jgi:hypothetical protein
MTTLAEGRARSAAKARERKARKPGDGSAGRSKDAPCTTPGRLNISSDAALTLAAAMGYPTQPKTLAQNNAPGVHSAVRMVAQLLDDEDGYTYQKEGKTIWRRR